MEYEIKVIVPNAEAQMAFCNKLAMYRFHWMSEQKADEIPALLRLTGELGQILVLDLLERKIGIAKRRSFQDGSSESQASIPNVFQSEVID